MRGLDGRQLLRVVAVLCLACLGLATNSSSFASGSFRAATLTWRRIAPSVITASLVSSWTTDFSSFRSLAIGDVVEVVGVASPVLRFGDGRSVIVSNEVVSVNTLTSSWTGTFSVNITYAPSSSSRFALEFSGCCRASYLTFGGLAPFNVTADVDLHAAAAPLLSMLPRLQVQPFTRVPIAFADAAPSATHVRIFFPPETTGFNEQSLPQPIQHLQSSFAIADSSNAVIFSLPLSSLTFMRLCSAFNDSFASSCSDIEIECAAPPARVSADASSMSSITPPGPPSMLDRFEGFDASYIVSAPLPFPAASANNPLSL
jgi:hypothetical protein